MTGVPVATSVESVITDAVEERRRPRRRRGRSIATKAYVPYLFILPVLVLFVGFKVYPIIASFVMSFTTRLGGQDVFAGVENYVRMVQDPTFWKALSNTFIILFVQVPIMLFLALLLAVALNAAFVRWMPLWRLGVFLPSVVGLVAYGILFANLLNRDFGLINWTLSWFGIPAVDWLTDPFWAKIAIMIAITWHATGASAIIYLAGLQSIPRELYEAAEVDGAGSVRRFWSLTIPLMRPIILFTIVMSTIGTLQLFSEPYVITAGGPNNETLTLSMYLYNNAFKYFDFGYASALAWVLALFVTLVGLIQVRFLGERDK